MNNEKENVKYSKKYEERKDYYIKISDDFRAKYGILPNVQKYSVMIGLTPRSTARVRAYFYEKYGLELCRLFNKRDDNHGSVNTFNAVVNEINRYYRVNGHFPIAQEVADVTGLTAIEVGRIARGLYRVVGINSRTKQKKY